MKTIIITLAILFFTGSAYADTATILRGDGSVENWQIIRNGNNIQTIGPDGEVGFGQTNGNQTWVYQPESFDRDSSYTVIQHDNNE